MATRFGISGDVAQPSRLDVVLTTSPFALSRREAKRRLAAGNVVVDGHPVSVASREIRRGTHVTLLTPQATVTILYMSDEIVVADKPDALPTQPSPGSSNPSLLEVLASQLKSQGTNPSLYVVHRLDTNTTGVVALARTKRSAEKVSREIASTARKRYLAVCEGSVEDALSIDQPIGRVMGNQFGVRADGKPARTFVEPLSISSGVSLLDVTIETGRTHQIRVHLAHIGHPIVGDRRYGSPGSRELTARPLLHAHVLELPGRGRFEAPVPEDLGKACQRFGLSFDRLE